MADGAGGMPEALIGDGGIGGGEFDQGHLALAQGQARHRVEGGGEAQVAGLVHHRLQPHPAGQPQGGGVAADRQGLAQADRTAAAAVEVLALPAKRGAADQVAGPGAAFDRHGVGHQFEGAAGLAQGHRGPVELALAVIATPDDRQDAAVAAVEHHHRALRNAEAAAGIEVIAQQSFDQLLQGRIQVGADEVVAFGGHIGSDHGIEVAAHLVAVVGKGAPAAGAAGIGRQPDRPAPGGAPRIGSEATAIDHLVQHRVAGFERRLGRAARVVAIGGGEQPHQQGRLLNLKPQGGLAEQASGGIFKAPADPEEGTVEVAEQQLPFAEAGLELEGDE